MIGLGEACSELNEVAAAGDAGAVVKLGWKLLWQRTATAASAETLRAACHGVPGTAGPARRIPAAPRAA